LQRRQRRGCAFLRFSLTGLPHKGLGYLFPGIFARLAYQQIAALLPNGIAA
jgi:hypothetical protein